VVDVAATAPVVRARARAADAAGMRADKGTSRDDGSSRRTPAAGRLTAGREAAAVSRRAWRPSSTSGTTGVAALLDQRQDGPGDRRLRWLRRSLLGLKGECNALI
jgi:hypothetical protein